MHTDVRTKVISRNHVRPVRAWFNNRVSMLQIIGLVGEMGEYCDALIHRNTVCFNVYQYSKVSQYYIDISMHHCVLVNKMLYVMHK